VIVSVFDVSFAVFNSPPPETVALWLTDVAEFVGTFTTRFNVG
jgi:hypothetical protein